MILLQAMAEQLHPKIESLLDNLNDFEVSDVDECDDISLDLTVSLF
jgi:hypothetical protein